MTEIIFLPHTQLKTHPHNMRQFYPEADVAEMAGSIRAMGGVLQALLIVPGGEKDTYFVVDGNMRLTATRTLGSEAPALKCEVIEAGHAEQLLAMAVTSRFHYPKDPISEAKHYARLQAEGYTSRQIALHTGIGQATIESRLRLLDLDPAIQELVGEGKLSKDRRVAEVLLGISDKQARLQIARKFAGRQTSIKAIEQACQRLNELLAKRVELTETVPTKTVSVSKAAPVYVEPASTRPQRCLCPDCASLVNELAEELCNDCGVTGLTLECLTCPGGLELINNLLKAAQNA